MTRGQRVLKWAGLYIFFMLHVAGAVWLAAQYADFSERDLGARLDRECYSILKAADQRWKGPGFLSDEYLANCIMIRGRADR